MLEISVTFEEFQLVFNFMLFFHFNTIFFNSWKMQGSKNLGGAAAPSSPPGLYDPVLWRDYKTYGQRCAKNLWKNSSL